MKNTFNFFLFILIIFFFISTFRYYFSKKNIEFKTYNRSNIDSIINNKISDLPILGNDTNNVIKFNDGYSNVPESDKPRSFWNLLK